MRFAPWSGSSSFQPGGAGTCGNYLAPETQQSSWLAGGILFFNQQCPLGPSSSAFTQVQALQRESFSHASAHTTGSAVDGKKSR